MVDIYDMTTWPTLKAQRDALRDQLFDEQGKDIADPVKLISLQRTLDTVEQRMRQGETHEYPW